MDLTLMSFSVRAEADMPLHDMAMRVMEATGCQLIEGSYHRIPAMSGNILGTNAGLFEWGGANGTVFRFEGYAEDRRFLEFMRDKPASVHSLDISQAVADLLTVFTDSKWRLPTPEDDAAEKVYGDSIDM
ncbi:hypothetical protein [Streptomyces sp. IBSBF 3010]|uniref:hypothetical protein n=1 Tax=Streptomyces sp. IBSBF 3010 TaxID=2903526 RepID=UPI002FDBDB83